VPVLRLQTNAEPGALTFKRDQRLSPLGARMASIQSRGARMPACFGRTYHEVKRWLWNFLTSSCQADRSAR